MLDDDDLILFTDEDLQREKAASVEVWNRSAEPGWIRVDDRLPDAAIPWDGKSYVVIVYEGRKIPEVDTDLALVNAIKYPYEDAPKPVLWMPLPEVTDGADTAEALDDVDEWRDETGTEHQCDWTGSTYR